MPVIYVFSQADDPDALCLVPDDEGGALLGVEHLIGIGRKRIAHVTGPETLRGRDAAPPGYRDALAKAGLPEIAGYYLLRQVVGGLGPRGGGQAVRRQGRDARRAVLRQ